MEQTMKSQMHRPVEPAKEDCCNSGCDPCIFDVYQHQLQLYEKCTDNKVLDTSASMPDNLIYETKYTAFRITYLQEICENHCIIAFSYGGEKQNGKLYWKPGQHFLMKYNNSDTAFSKAYTPFCLPEWSKDLDYDFLILVKKYNEGLVSNFLCSKEIGDEILWRGPYGSFVHVANKYKRLCMIAQGTGIAPFYSIIESILNNEDDFTNIILLCCYNSFNTILLRKELYLFKQYWNFNYKIFLGNNDRTISIMYQEPIESRRLDFSYVKEVMWPLQNEAFLVCGSSEFMKCYIDNLQNNQVEKDRIIHF